MATTNDAAEVAAEVAPEWLDRQFIADILAREEGRAVTVQQLRVARAVAKGENYASLLLRVGVDYDVEGSAGDSPQSTSLIVKTLPLGQVMREIIRENGAFDREGKIYLSTIPAFEAMLNEKIAGEKIVFAPKFLRCNREYTIVLKDLKEEGFRMTSRHLGMDLEHTKLVLRNLARFHAASVALHARDPEHVESYTDIFFKPEKRESADRFMSSTLENIAKAVETWDEKEFAGYAEKIRTFAKTAVDQVMEVIRPSKNFLNVLNHGDCWVNNSLFRYAEEDGKLLEMRFIDFQVVRYGPPTLDLQYFLYTSVQEDVRDEHWRELLEVYAAQLRETLQALGAGERAVSADALEEDLRARGAFGLVSACTVLCAIVADPSEHLSLDDLTKEDLQKSDKLFGKVAAGRRFNTFLKRLLPIFVKNGPL